MTELLFEIFCEEIPARMQARAGRDLETALVAGLKKAGLTVEGARHWAGPRRLGFTAQIPVQSPDVSEERKGPRVGAPERALAGFMRGAGLSDISQAEIREDKKGEHYVAVIEKPGQASADILAALIPEVMNNFPWPKSMKSGGSHFKWVRPLQSMICLLGGDVVPVEAGGITAGNTTEGHRRHGRGPFTVGSYAAYKETLECEGHVLLSADDRKDRILTQARKACADAGLELVEDEGLLNEVAGLAEWPVVILGDMDPAFLELPGEVIRLSMRTHQKYFTVKNKDGSLAPNFIVVANQAAPDGGKAIAAGNSRVLSARLDDARFFQSEDAKKNLIDYYDKLDTVVFHKKLGSIKDKAERVAALARELAPKVGADPDAAEEAARLAKCDLVTQTVIEFTSLQGQIGRLMYERENGLTPAPSVPSGNTSPASGGGKSSPIHGGSGTSALAEGSKGAIALAIEDHYKPQGPSDSVPTNPVAVAVALADKLDTLVGFWAIDEKPTGSKDPFALRRAALGVVRIILENGVRLHLGDIVESSARILRKLQLFDKIAKDEMFALSNLVKASDTLANLNFGPKKLIFPDSSDQTIFRSNIEMARYFSLVAVNANVRDDILLAECAVTPHFFEDEEHEFVNVQETINDVYQAGFVIQGFTCGEDLHAFIADRLKVYLKDQGIRHDLIDAVFALGEDDLVSIVNRVEALQSFLTTEAGENLLAGYKRAANILKAEAKKGDLPEGEPSSGTVPAEGALFDALQSARPKVDAALAKEDYAGAMTALAALRAPIDAFFDNVMVVSDNDAERQNRLRLLGSIRDIAATIANFDKIDG